MLCPKCGAEIRDGLSFCPKCGAEFKTKRASSQNKQISENTAKEHFHFIDESSDKETGSKTQHTYYYKPKFYQKTWFIVVSLIFFWPLGLFLMWKFSRWNKIVKIVITILCAFALMELFVEPDEETDLAVDTTSTQQETESVSETSEAIVENEAAEKKQKESINMVNGLSKLQSFYLQIDDTYTENKVKQIAEENGLYCETINNYPIYTLDVSETKTTGYGPGAEPWYQFDTDSIHLNMSNDDGNKNQYYVFSKDYYVRDKYMSVNYTFYDKELYTDNTIPGYAERGKGKRTDKWDSVEDALRYVLK